jgi:hypothetical protein
VLKLVLLDHLRARGDVLAAPRPHRLTADRRRHGSPARSGSARVLMACEMFGLARKLVIASIRAEDPTIDDARLRARVFERFYGEDFSVEERSRLLAAIR